MLKFSGCSCLSSGRKPKRRPAHAFMEAIASNEGMQPAKVTYQIGTRLSFLKGKQLPQREYFSADRQPNRNTGKPAPINCHTGIG